MGKIIWHATIAIFIAFAIFQYARPVSDDDAAYPRKPIRVIVPYDPGGGTDTFVRIIQKGIEDNKLLPQPLVVLNKPGGATTIGSAYVRNARPDGYTILCLHEALMTSKATGQSPYGPESFEPVAATGEVGLVIVASRNSEFDSLTELMAAAKERPNTVTFGAYMGMPSHFSGVMLEKTQPGARFRFVSTGGGASRLSALMGGHLDCALFSVSEFIRFRENGLKALAYLGEQRHAALQNAPTATELGFPVANSNLQYWWFPKGTDREIVAYMADVLTKAMDSDYVERRLEELHIIPRVIRGEALRKRIENRMDRFEGMTAVTRVELPNIVGWTTGATLILGGFIGIRTLLRGRPAARRIPSMKLSFDLSGAVVGLTALYMLVLGLGILSFVWATVIFITASGLLLAGRDRRNWVYIAELALCLSFGLHYIFVDVFAVGLP